MSNCNHILKFTLHAVEDENEKIIYFCEKCGKKFICIDNYNFEEIKKQKSEIKKNREN
jgi:DNA-directed RNA polymerase subunit RPC12/RpoP